ncbi:MAG: DNA repair protein RecN [Bacteroidales bacterium]|nr:DNA repair protein RecN [Bacteroidales bacterium]
MLCNLLVENYALISKLEIEFRKGLTIITGETGAGKSILLGALALILGKRADANVLLDKEKKCIVEGTFNIENYGLQSFFTEKGIDYDDQPIARREISATGKSRAFINDFPVNLEVLTEFGLKLIDIHSQHQNLNLADSVFQMKVIDSFVQDQELLETYRSHFHEFKAIQKKFRQLTEESVRSKSDLDYFLFQYTQLAEARLTEGEQEELEFEHEKLTHAEEIKTGLTTASSLLQSDGNSALQQIKDSLGAIHKIKKFLHENESLSARIDAAYIEIKDISREIETLNDQLYYDPDRLTQVNDRLNLLYSLEKKHRVSGLAELIAVRDHLKEKIEEINAYDFNLEELEKKLSEIQGIVGKYADKLSHQRQKAIVPFRQRVTEMLHDVGIPNAGFSVLLEKLDDFSEHGSDRIQFLFTANRNMPLQDIARVASGGELSRLMLCVKSLMSDSIGLPTIIFDEIDTGVSGEIAERVGNIINRMADKMQIINITHLPQVASKGKYHYLVYKTDDEKTTVTHMKLLSPEERHIEIAKMLSGEEITHAALENARILLGY